MSKKQRRSDKFEKEITLTFNTHFTDREYHKLVNGLSGLKPHGVVKTFIDEFRAGLIERLKEGN